MRGSVDVTVTGAAGFVGAHVLSQLRGRGHRVTAVVAEGVLPPPADRVVTADLAAAFPQHALGEVVIHLAGYSEVGPSFADPQRYLNHNSALVTRLCEAMLHADHPMTAVVAGSASIYGGSTDATPMNESAPYRPSSPYAISKVVLEYQVDYYRARGLNLRVLRPFNNVGPGQPPGFFVSDLTAKVSALAPGQPLPTGRLDAVRDFTDVRDVARAYVDVALAPTTPHDVYNVASGRPVVLSEALELICASLGRPVPPLSVDADQARTSDPSIVVGDATRLRDDLGWEPTIPLAQSIADYHNSLERT